MHRAALLLLLCTPTHAFEGVFSADHSSYRISHNGATLFDAPAGVAVFMNNTWHAQEKKSLIVTSSEKISGRDTVLGAWSGEKVIFTPSTVEEHPIAARLRNYVSHNVIIADLTYPNGAKETVSGDFSMSNFPAFTTIALPDVLSWEGSFMQSVRRQSRGTQGGPSVFYNASAGAPDVVIASPLDNFKSFTAGNGKIYDGSLGWSPGISGNFTEVPVGHTQSFLFHLGKGVTNTIGSWGDIMKVVHNATKVSDRTIETVGYQTDNGAHYVFCEGNCSATLLEVKKGLGEQGITLGYLSFQGKGASQSSGSAPWCITEWGPEGGLGEQYPVPLPEFAEALGVPMQYYAPYFCNDSAHFHKDSPWEGVRSSTALPGCGSFDFFNIAPQQSYSFYSDLFKTGIANGMHSFEPDFMNQNYNCVPDFVTTMGRSEEWMSGMADAAHDLGITVQWCYATPSDVMQALHYPSVTNFRVSNDFCYGNSWNVGESSLLAWAMGAAPSKDTLWTSNNDRFVVTRCPWTRDHETPAVELHVVIALMTTGPVGISDGLNMTNATLLKRTITANGSLLQPSKPLTAAESELMQKTPSGHVYTTFSGPSSKDAVWAYSFVTFMLSGPRDIHVSDLYPAIPAVAYLHRSFNAPYCIDGGSSEMCVVESGGEGVVFTAPASSYVNVTGGTDLEPVVTTVYPVLGGGGGGGLAPVLLGELGKYVPLSPVRFVAVDVARDAVVVTMRGVPGEEVTVTAIDYHNGKKVCENRKKKCRNNICGPKYRHLFLRFAFFAYNP